MPHVKKLFSIALALLVIFFAFATPALAAAQETQSGGSFTETLEHRFYQLVDRLISGLGKILNTVIPGLNWTGSIGKLKDYVPSFFFAGKKTFDETAAENAAWRMGFSAASFLTNINPTDGSYYIAGSLGVMQGNVPNRVLDDQGVNTFALSDGTTTVTYSSIDGFGLTRGDVFEIRSRLADFAKEHKIASINVSAVHQHSCIDTLGLGAPIVPAILKNPTDILFGGKHLVVGRNPVFMEALYQAVTATVIDAVESMDEGSLYYGSADISEHIYDKRDPQVFDGMFHRLRFVPNDETRNEIWVGQTCIHPVTIGSSSGVLSADYPHYVEQFVKEKAGADFVFMQGAELAVSSNAETFRYDPEGEPNARAAAMGETLGSKLIAITQEEPLPALLNIAFTEVTLDAENPIHIIAGREGLLASVMRKNGFGYSVVTELGYMELGGKLGVALVPGEIEPAILFGGAVSAADSWTGESWDYAPWAKTCGAQRLLCFGLCNDQIGYILCDNDYRSMLTENEEINALSKRSGSVLTNAFEAMIARVKS